MFTWNIPIQANAFGLKNAPATFQWWMDRFCRSLSRIKIFTYLDDIIVVSSTLEQHINDLSTVFERLEEYNLRANRKKCNFLCSEVRDLGHIITSDGIKTDPEKVAAIEQMRPPRNVRELLSFVQTCSWYHRFGEGFSKIAEPLTRLTKKDATWQWSNEQQNAFQTLKTLMSTAPILRQVDETLPFILRTEASNYAIGAV